MSRPERPKDMGSNAMLSSGWDPGTEKKDSRGKTSDNQIKSGFIVMNQCWLLSFIKRATGI